MVILKSFCQRSVAPFSATTHNNCLSLEHYVLNRVYIMLTLFSVYYRQYTVQALRAKISEASYQGASRFHFFTFPFLKNRLLPTFTQHTAKYTRFLVLKDNWDWCYSQKDETRNWLRSRCHKVCVHAGRQSYVIQYCQECLWWAQFADTHTVWQSKQISVENTFVLHVQSESKWYCTGAIICIP